MSEVANFFNNLENFPRKSEDGKLKCVKVLLEIDESVTKYWVDSSKDGFRSERESFCYNVFMGWFIVRQEGIVCVKHVMRQE